MLRLTTPERSHSTPLIAPKMSGTASSSEPCSRPVTGSVSPSAVHTRKEVTRANPTMAACHLTLRRPRARISPHTAAAMAMRPKPSAVTLVGMVHDGSSIASSPSVNRKVVSAPGVLNQVKRAVSTTASTRVMIGPRRDGGATVGVSASRGAGTAAGSTTALIRSIPSTG